MIIEGGIAYELQPNEFWKPLSDSDVIQSGTLFRVWGTLTVPISDLTLASAESLISHLSSYYKGTNQELMAESTAEESGEVGLYKGAWIYYINNFLSESQVEEATISTVAIKSGVTAWVVVAVAAAIALGVGILYGARKKK